MGEGGRMSEKVKSRVVYSKFGRPIRLLGVTLRAHEAIMRILENKSTYKEEIARGSFALPEHWTQIQLELEKRVHVTTPEELPIPAPTNYQTL